MTRPSWDETWMTCAEVIGRRSRCSRRQVGAIIVTGDNRVVSQSYNGPPAGLHFGHVDDCSHWCPRAIRLKEREVVVGEGPPDYSECVSVHAEANALLRAAWHDMQDGTIYVPTAMCVNCARLVANSGITRVVHYVPERFDNEETRKTELMLETAGLSIERM